MAEFAPEALEEYVRCFADPAAVYASCEDYRAGATVDDRLDAEDLGAAPDRLPGAGPVGYRGDRPSGRGPLAGWRPWCEEVTGHGVPSGHFLPEEAPEATLDALAGFFSR